MIRISILLLLGWLGGMAPLAAQPVQSLDSIQEVARQFLEDESTMHSGQIVIQLGRIDSRLRLAECDEPLEAFWPEGARQVGNVTVGVRCSAPTPWSLFVRARVEVHDDILVSARPLSRGTTLSQNDVELVSQDITRLSTGYFTDPAQLGGRRAQPGDGSGGHRGTPW